MAGRRPKPTAIKALAGNPGKRALNQKEPKPRSKRPKMPAEFKGTRKEFHWRRLTRELAGMQLLTSADGDAIAMYCDYYVRWEDATKEIADNGMIVHTENGFPVQSPYLGIANKAMAAMQKLLVEFGMTPASRSRIQLPEGKADDPFEAFLRRKLGD